MQEQSDENNSSQSQKDNIYIKIANEDNQVNEQIIENQSDGQDFIASLKCTDIYFKCDSPVFQGCQCLLGFIEIILPGIGLFFFPCYGYKRPDCCAVCCAGIWQLLTAPFLIGIVSSCCIGWKMMFCC